jgi:membrane protein
MEPDLDGHRPSLAGFLRWVASAARELVAVIWNAIDHLLWHDGLILASASAFALIFAIFPFLIFLIGLGGWLGGAELADFLADIAFDALPDPMAVVIQPELRRVIDEVGHGGVITVSLLVTLVTITSAVEAMRDGLNRAYGCVDNRNFLIKRLASLVFVFIGIAFLIAVAALSIVAPLAIQFAAAEVPGAEVVNVDWYPALLEGARQVLLVAVLIFMLGSFHLFLPARKRHIKSVAPGVLATLFLWWLAGIVFGFYLNRLADFSAVYAGLGGVIAFMFFLYIVTLIFQFGAELNRAIAERRGRVAPCLDDAD